VNETRRAFMAKGLGVASAAGALAVVGATGAGADDKAGEPKGVAACGLCCGTCPLMKAGKCKGCGAGNAVSAEKVRMKNCPVLTCANMKQIAYCGTDCMMFPQCGKLIGRPYDKGFMDGIKTRLG